MFYGWLVFHVLVSLALVIVVLMQSSKGEGLAGSAFGGAMSGAVFGGRGAASFLSKATTVLAILFMVNCGALAFMSAGTRTVAQGGATPTTSAVTKQAQKEQQQAQAAQQQFSQPVDTSSLIQIAPGEAVDQGATGDTLGSGN